jgi:hypothetical protein
VKCGSQGSEGGASRQRRACVATVATGAVKEVLQGSNGGGHGFFETEASAPGLCAKGGEEVAQRLRTSGASRMRGIRGSEIIYQLIAKVMDGCGFHDDASTKKWPPAGVPGGHCWCNDAGPV